MRLHPGVSCEQVGNQWVVLLPRGGVVHHLDGPAATVIDTITSGRPVPPAHDEVVAWLIELGILTDTARLSRRDVLAAGAGIAAGGITALALPTAALATSTNATPTPPDPDPLLGTQWTEYAGHSGRWKSVAFGNDVWIAVNDNTFPGLMRSTDNGATWANSGFTQPFNPWESVAYGLDDQGNGVWVAVSQINSTLQSNVMRSTNDGVNWVGRSPAENNAWRSVAYGDGVWISVASNGDNRVMRSTDGGFTWSAIAAAAANPWQSVAYGSDGQGNGVWVAVADNNTNRVMRSTDGGLTWSGVAAAEDNQWRWVAYGNGVWVAVANSGTNRVMRSTNGGLTWDPIQAAEDNPWRSVAYGTDSQGNGVWVAVASNGTNRVMRSTDGGVTWEAVQAAEDNQWWAVAFGDGVFVSVAQSGTNRVMRSPALPS